MYEQAQFAIVNRNAGIVTGAFYAEDSHDLSIAAFYKGVGISNHNINIPVFMEISG